MTKDDEETREHPVYPDAPPPVEAVSDPASASATAEDAAAEAAAAQAPAPVPVAPAVDPLEQTTTITVAPPGAAPIAAAHPQPPAYPGQGPSPAWPGQPPAAANLPGQWQASGYGQPAYGGQPGYAAPQQWANEPTYGTNVFVALAAMLLVILGIALAVLGAWLLTQGPALGELVQRLRSVDLLVFKPNREQLRTLVSASPGALMLLGFLQLLVGAFVLGHRSWARWLGVVMALLGLAFSVVALASTMALVPGPSVQLIVVIAFLVVYAFAVLALIAGGGHFRARYTGR